ncbi:hypothetical protein [Mucilaginibacter sp.]|uniref:hypothetical protein n=1 Tax=Mucilaginibacter sp. TaxID=1882438 RepID=UPI00263045D0|nr:hypothetical protein [Mucilaginibacter sp.]
MKSNQKSSQQRGFLPHRPLPCKSGKTKGPVLLPPVVAPAHRFSKITNARTAAQPNTFYPPEAYLLTLEDKTNNLLNNENLKKKRKGLSGLCGHERHQRLTMYLYKEHNTLFCTFAAWPLLNHPYLKEPATFRLPK